MKRGLLTKASVLIHATALTPEMLADVKDAGAKIVWSPQSNLRLYGDTTNAAEAIKREIPLGVGADWLPSGSQSLLAELKIARRVLVQQGVDLSEKALHKKLVRMVTEEGAAIAGLSEHLGTLAEGRPADVVVMERRFDDPWENVVEADPSWVQLVMMGGDLAYGRPDWIGELADAAQLEQVIAWGKPMLIDTSYRANATGAEPPPPLKEVRAKLRAVSADRAHLRVTAGHRQEQPWRTWAAYGRGGGTDTHPSLLGPPRRVARIVACTGLPAAAPKRRPALKHGPSYPLCAVRRAGASKHPYGSRSWAGAPGRICAPGGIRTRGLGVSTPLLCPLSYRRVRSIAELHVGYLRKALSVPRDGRSRPHIHDGVI